MEEEALDEVDSHFVERVATGRGFDAFGDDATSEVVGEIGDEACDVAIGGIGGKVGDEFAIDLDFVEVQVPEATERGVAGPEVVKTELHAKAGEGDERRLDAGGVDVAAMLGDLDGERVGGQALMGEYATDVVGKDLIGQAAGRDVDRHPYVVSLGSPFAALSDRFFEHEVRQRPTEPSGHVVGKELPRGEDPQEGVVPSDEGFGSLEFARGDVEDPLVVQEEPTLVDALEQVHRRRQRRTERRGHDSGSIMRTPWLSRPPVEPNRVNLSMVRKD